MIGADEQQNWTRDRDQHLTFATDPAMLARAAEMAQEDAEI